MFPLSARLVWVVLLAGFFSLPVQAQKQDSVKSGSGQKAAPDVCELAERAANWDVSEDVFKQLELTEADQQDLKKQSLALNPQKECFSFHWGAGDKPVLNPCGKDHLGKGLRALCDGRQARAQQLADVQERKKADEQYRASLEQMKQMKKVSDIKSTGGSFRATPAPDSTEGGTLTGTATGSGVDGSRKYSPEQCSMFHDTWLSQNCSFYYARKEKAPGCDGLDVTLEQGCGISVIKKNPVLSLFK